MTHIIAIGNHKGGVGKTTAVFSIGACLAENDQRTLIVDLDSQSHLTLAAGLDADELPCTLVDLLDPDETDVDPLAAIHNTSMPKLDILPTDVRMTDIERRLYEIPEYENRLALVLELFEPQYDYILLDCPPSLSGLTLMAMTAADCALIPVTCDYFATRGLMRVTELIEIVQQRTNPTLNFYLFANLFDGRTLISRRILEQIKEHFPDHMLDTFVGLDTRVRESPLAGDPIIVYAPKSRASQQYRNLTKELMQKLGDEGA